MRVLNRFSIYVLGVAALWLVLFAGCRRKSVPISTRPADTTQVLSLKSHIRLRSMERNLNLQTHILYKPHQVMWLSVRAFFGIEVLRLRYTTEKIQFKMPMSPQVNEWLLDSMPSSMADLSPLMPIHFLLSGQVPEELIRSLASAERKQDTLWVDFAEGPLRCQVAAHPATRRVWYLDAEQMRPFAQTAPPAAVPSPPSPSAMRVRLKYQYDRPLAAVPDWPSAWRIQIRTDSLMRLPDLYVRHTQAKWLPATTPIPKFLPPKPNEDLK